MTNKKRFKKISITIIIIFLFFTFSFLIGSTNTRAEIPLKLNDENMILDGEKNGDGEEEKTIGKGLNIEELILLVQEATSKHLAILQEVLDYAPEAAKGSIWRAMEASTRGNVKVIKALNKIKSSNKDNKDNEDKGQKTFHIISSCNRGGTITPKGIQFSQGESIGFEIITDTGYTLLWIRVDNKKVEAVSSYSFDDGVERNHTIHAHFKKDKGSTKQNDDID